MVVVTAILAAITVVAYNGISSRATGASVKSDMTGFAKKIEMYRINNTSDLYPTSSAEFTSSLRIRFSRSPYMTTGTGNNLLYCPLSGGTGWALVAVDKWGQGWKISNTSSTEPYAGAGVLTTGLGGQSTVCPALPGGSATGNVWAYTASNWSAWTD